MTRQTMLYASQAGMTIGLAVDCSAVPPDLLASLCTNSSSIGAIRFHWVIMPATHLAMIIGALLAVIVTESSRHGSFIAAISRIGAQIGCFATMFVGMTVGGSLGSQLTASLSMSSFAGLVGGMVLGMWIGMALASFPNGTRKRLLKNPLAYPRMRHDFEA